MAFSDYKSLAQVQEKFQIKHQEADFVESLPAKPSKNVLGLPLLPVVGAKRNDFEQGWGQCLAELIACDRLNKHSHPMYSIVTDGKLWGFGRLEHQVFTKNLASYTITDLDPLFCVLNALFHLATQNLALSLDVND